MKPKDIKVCIMRIEGTNCEDETKRAFDLLGANTEIVNLKQFYAADISKERKRKLADYDVILIAGGFASGDYVRAGAVWASILKTKLEKEFNEFIKSGKVVGGICNGFQVLTETGALPGSFASALAPNTSSLFECRFTYMKTLQKCACTETVDIGSVVSFPIGHGEGRFTLPLGKEKECLKELEDNNQIIFRYTTLDGEFANGKYPTNPNGAYFDIGGICNLERNVFGMMPHPERVLDRFNHLDWTRNEKITNHEGDGLNIYRSIIEYIKKNL